MSEMKRFFTDAGNAEDIDLFAGKLQCSGDILSVSKPYVHVRTLTHTGTFVDEQAQEPIVIVSRQADYQSPHGDCGDMVDHYALSLSFLEALAQIETVAQRQRLMQISGEVRRAQERGTLKSQNRDEISLPHDRHSTRGRQGVMAMTAS